MNKHEEPFRPEAVDEEIEQFLQMPQRERRMQFPGGPTVDAIQQLIEEENTIIEHAWERIAASQATKPYTSEASTQERKHESGEILLAPLQDRHEARHAHKRAVRLLTASLVATLVMGSFLAMLVYRGPRMQMYPVAQTAPSATQTATPAATQTIPPDIEPAVLDMLNNIKDNGFNPHAGSLGGLYINWSPGTTPLQTNIGGSTSMRQDSLTEMRYLHALWLYKSESPQSSDFDDEIARYTAIVKQAFPVNFHSESAWLYPLFMQTYQLSHDNFYLQVAESLAAGYAQAFDPHIGSIVQTTSSPEGTYTVDLVLESACALVQAGTQFKNPQWVQDGMSTINFVYTHAYIPQYHIFPLVVSQVLLPDLSANPDEVFYPVRMAQGLVGEQIFMVRASMIIMSLLETYQVTQNQDFLTKAVDLLDRFSLPANPLGMWDTQAGGYFSALQLTGHSPKQPGEIRVNMTMKGTIEQADMLLAFHMANQATHGRYTNMEQQLLRVALKKVYVPAFHGTSTFANEGWQFPNLVTAEATVAELDALLGLALPVHLTLSYQQ